MMGARKLYFEVLGELCHDEADLADGGSTAFMSNERLIFDTSFSFNIESVGFSATKWRNLVYSYIEPRSFETFLKACLRAARHKVVGYTCPVFSLHNSGNCILGWTFDGSTLVAYSRVSLWAPTGALDMALLTQVARKVGATKIVWHLSSIKLSTLKGLPSVLAMGVFSDSPFVIRNRSKIPTGEAYGAKKASRFIDRGSNNTDGDLPSIDFYQEFLSPHVDGGDITPESLAQLAGIRGVKIRNFLRDEQLFMKWGYAQFYVGEEHYRWKTYADPMVKLIMAKFNIPLPEE